jgi:hypothetical protein
MKFPILSPGTRLHAPDRGFGAKDGVVVAFDQNTNEAQIKWDDHPNQPLTYLSVDLTSLFGQGGCKVVPKWIRKQTNPGTEFRGWGGKVVVERVEWAKPGFSGATSRGWVIKVKGTRLGAAHRTAQKAMQQAELPGVTQEIERMLNGTK